MSASPLRKLGGGGKAFTAVLPSLVLTTTGALAAQNVIVPSAEDRILEMDFQDVFRIGSEDEDWSILTFLTNLGFDASGSLQHRRFR